MELSSSSSTGSSKRAKAPNVNQVVVSCLVDGCDSDLSQSREYHRRHKVCEPHSKTPMVTIAGRQQRFCQQCSRFHSLEEFDEGKRSCRKRLDGHNRRRRKPQSDSLPRSSSGIFFSTPQGTRVVSFGGGPQVHGNPGSDSSGWVVKAENESSSRSSLLFHNNALPYPVSSGYKEMNQFQFIQGNGHDQSILPAASNRMLFCDGGINNGAGRALSLLSSSPANQTRDVGELQYGGVGQLLFPCTNYSHNKVGVAVSDDGDLSAHPNNNNDNDNTTLHFHSMFQDAPDGSSPTAGAGGASHQTLSFGW